jgi:hypothetical protein
MRALIIPWIALLGAATAAEGQPVQFDRLSAEDLPVLAPSARIEGRPGNMRISQAACRADSELDQRRRIVDIAIQEWAFFGFTVVDQTNADPTEPWPPRNRRRTPWLDPAESARVADSIAGYWSITGDGAWILSRQNAIWNSQEGVAARWEDPWSAAFISWVMCESGLASESQFRRAIAHHTYIDQAIEARDVVGSPAAFVAYDVGEEPVQPGDLVCSARRPAYREIAERRRELGTGIRSHCDIVVRVDAAQDRILVIGGNVRGAVRLKLLSAVFERDENSVPRVQSVGRGRRAVFAHLQLRAEPIGSDALASSPTFKALSPTGDAPDWLEVRLAGDALVRGVELTSTAEPAADRAIPPL